MHEHNRLVIPIFKHQAIVNIDGVRLPLLSYAYVGLYAKADLLQRMMLTDVLSPIIIPFAFRFFFMVGFFLSLAGHGN